MLAKHNHFVPTAWPFCPAVPENGTKKCARMWKIKSPLSGKCNFLIQELDFISVCCGKFDLPKIHFGGYFSHECVSPGFFYRGLETGAGEKGFKKTGG